MSDYENDDRRISGSVIDGVGVVAKTATGVGVGLLGAAVGIAALATADVVLPALLCLKAAGVVGGGIGLVFGVSSIKKRKDMEEVD